MKNKLTLRGVVSKITLFVSACLLIALAFNSCDMDDVVYNDETSNLKAPDGPDFQIDLTYPLEDVIAGEDFDISFSSNCGKIMIERGFVPEYDAYGVIINKTYADLSCEMDNLLWEAVGEDVYENCDGGTITENIAAPGTYIYRAKLNFKANKKSDCLDCGNTRINQFECFMITVIAGNQNDNTFTDTRDGHVYKWVQIGDQIWMAENLAFATDGSYVNDNPAYTDICGRYYTWEEAKTVAPSGWHVPTEGEWYILLNYLYANTYCGDNQDLYAKSIALPDVWTSSTVIGAPGNPNDGCDYNSTGFSAFPAGFFRPWMGPIQNVDYGTWASFWTTDFNPYQTDLGTIFSVMYDYSGLAPGATSKEYWYNVRCVKDAN